jgi:hypothetical protein
LDVAAIQRVRVAAVTDDQIHGRVLPNSHPIGLSGSVDCSMARARETDAMKKGRRPKGFGGHDEKED